MRTILVLALHLVIRIAKLLGPGGVRGLVAETLLVKHQLLVINRSRRRAPNLTGYDRILMGLCSLLMASDRIRKAADQGARSIFIARCAIRLTCPLPLVPSKAAVAISRWETMSIQCADMAKRSLDARTPRPASGRRQGRKSPGATSRCAPALTALDTTPPPHHLIREVHIFE